MFFCVPQQAFMQVGNCQKLRNRPVGKVPAGTQPKLRACERCTMHVLVDSKKVPMVNLKDYLGGKRPKTVNLESPSIKKLLQAAENQRPSRKKAS